MPKPDINQVIANAIKQLNAVAEDLGQFAPSELYGYGQEGRNKVQSAVDHLEAFQQVLQKDAERAKSTS